MELLAWHTLLQEHVLGPAAGTVDGVALLSPQGEAIYAVGSLRSALCGVGDGRDPSSPEGTRPDGGPQDARAVRQQFVGLFGHALDGGKKADRLRRMAAAGANVDVAADERAEELLDPIVTGTHHGRSQVKDKHVLAASEGGFVKRGFELLGHKMAVCRADTQRVLAIAPHKSRGLVVHRLVSKGDTLLLITFAPARPHTTQRIVGLADRFTILLR